MENYIVRGNNDKLKYILNKDIVETLKKLEPTGCPFKFYTMFDLLDDIISIHYMSILQPGENISIIEYIKRLQARNEAYSVVYGKFYIDLINKG